MENERYAVIDAQGNVVNMIRWDGISPWRPREGHRAIDASNEPDAMIGGRYEDGKFIRIPPPPPEPLPPALLRELAIQEKRQKDAAACDRITLLEYAIELDMQQGGEAEKLRTWKKYRVLLNRVDISTAPNIDWPTPPDEEA
ncbi:tail fiber assembly protein [Sodalis sp.]|uniref:tail fiber assembly protein n=1 Tax=Sodalis sp. (in: enterobacteria) TaxID=1898979 RepID=UPI00387392DB